MIRHKQEEAIINWLNEFKKRSEPFRINKAEIIFDPERFAEMNIERIKSAVSIQTYKNSLQEVTKVKNAFDSLI
tara:strand:- start:1421 stop:1642 length:222 start_codon:yes stop_codon:yes gene_type:complete